MLLCLFATKSYNRFQQRNIMMLLMGSHRDVADDCLRGWRLADLWRRPPTAADSPLWHIVWMTKRQRRAVRRQRHGLLKKKLKLLGTRRPSVSQLHVIKRSHTAPSLYREAGVASTEPMQQDVANIFRESPKNSFLTIPKETCGKTISSRSNTLPKPGSCLPTCQRVREAMSRQVVDLCASLIIRS